MPNTNFFFRGLYYFINISFLQGWTLLCLLKYGNKIIIKNVNKCTIDMFPQLRKLKKNLNSRTAV